jgi:hypothetical protein
VVLIWYASQPFWYCIHASAMRYASRARDVLPRMRHTVSKSASPCDRSQIYFLPECKRMLFISQSLSDGIHRRTTTAEARRASHAALRAFACLRKSQVMLTRSSLPLRHWLVLVTDREWQSENTHFRFSHIALASANTGNTLP